MKRKTSVRVMAIIGIVLLVGLYVTALVLAIVGKDPERTAVKIALAGTFIIPVLIYIISMFYKLSHKKSEPEEMVFTDEKDDMFTDEDIK